MVGHLPDTALGKPIQLVAFDVDGVLTDGGLYFSTSGEELKRFSVKDGQGIALLNQLGFQTAIITARAFLPIKKRAHELGIRYVFQKVKPKLPVLQQLAAELKLTQEQVAYVGDDWPDVACLNWAGLGCCPQDAVKPVRESAQLISQYKGGHGAVREICDWLLEAQGKQPY